MRCVTRTGLPMLLALVAAAAVVVPSVQASRAPTGGEAAAIRAAAVASLHGSGWRVSAIRVSTVPTSDRYASASVDDATAGVGGEMILRRHGGRWSQLFLGTSDFCRARAPRAVLDDLGFACGPKPRLRLRPTTVSRGGRMTLIGTDFRVRRSVWLGVGPPQSEASKVGSTRTDAIGGFRVTLEIGRAHPLGRWVILACQPSSCKLKAAVSFRVVAR